MAKMENRYLLDIKVLSFATIHGRAFPLSLASRPFSDFPPKKKKKEEEEEEEDGFGRRRAGGFLPTEAARQEPSRTSRCSRDCWSAHSGFDKFQTRELSVGTGANESSCGGPRCNSCPYGWHCLLLWRKSLEITLKTRKFLSFLSFDYFVSMLATFIMRGYFNLNQLYGHN
ncbi:uncharacterized protein LOC120289427 [Eucalyptus grandis]|uniref:uncharacterized protein LOC120289427 n=1 Tax=Eucalyptus grandis TaxID=71139 RepID=UPI00192F03BB|nr:uncharacterized protein LOC120289427 [Eucalyptus grandis]